MEVVVLNRQRTHPIRREELVTFVHRIVEELPVRGVDSVAVSLVSDRKMREFNRRFRDQDQATDVLSFPAGDDEVPDGERHLGDIVVSVSTAAEQARVSLDRELKVLVLHGYLHLLGYDHETDDGEMMRLQRKLVRRLLRAPEARAR